MKAIITLTPEEVNEIIRQHIIDTVNVNPISIKIRIDSDPFDSGYQFCGIHAEIDLKQM